MALVEGGDGVDVEIHAQRMTQLIGHQLRVNADVPREASMRAAHDLKRGPFQLDGFQPWRNQPPPGVVASEWSR